MKAMMVFQYLFTQEERIDCYAQGFTSQVGDLAFITNVMERVLRRYPNPEYWGTTEDEQKQCLDGFAQINEMLHQI